MLGKKLRKFLGIMSNFLKGIFRFDNLVTPPGRLRNWRDAERLLYTLKGSMTFRVDMFGR